MASRKEEKERRRRERLAREQTERRQAQRRRRYGYLVGGGVTAAAIVVVAAVVVAGGGGDATSPPAQRITNLQDAAKAANCKLQSPAIEGVNHLAPGSETPRYSTDPPTSGDHDPTPTEDGAYDDAQSPGGLLHALEHGRIEVHYKPSIGKQRVGQLKGLFDQDRYHMILTPNDSMPFQVAATAWGQLAGCKRVSDESFDVLRAFTDRYRDKGPESVP